MSENKFNNINTTKCLDDEVFFYAKPLSSKELIKTLKNKVFYVKVVFYNKDKQEILVDYPKDIRVRDVTKKDKEFFAKKGFKYDQDIIISHDFNIKKFLLSKDFKEKKDIENEEGLFLEDVKYISCWIDANNDTEVRIEYIEELVVRVCPKECIVETIDFKLNNGKYFKVSKETMEFILSYEGFKEYPYVPRKKENGEWITIGTSGITIGYGYDLGQQSSSQIANDLSGLFTNDEIKRFQSVAGLKKTDAIQNLYKVKDISITKNKALELTKKAKANYAQKTYNIWSEVIDLHPHCQGALLSIVYNRGNSLLGDKRIEMKNIQNDLQRKEFNNISNEIRKMKRHWIEKGLINRRETEAVYFENGLKCNFY